MSADDFDLTRDVKIVFFLIFDSRNQKFDFFSIIVYQPTWETGSDRRQVRMTSPAVRCQCADVSLVVPSAPRPRNPLQLRLQQQWCIPPTATVWHIQALARRTVARGIVDQRLLRRRTDAHQLRRDKAVIKSHPPADRHATWWYQLISRANVCRYHRRVNWKRHTESWNLTPIDETGSVFSKNTSKPPTTHSQFRRAIHIPHTGTGRRPCQ